jgi:hypothetical protein
MPYIERRGRTVVMDRIIPGSLDELDSEVMRLR